MTTQNDIRQAFTQRDSITTRTDTDHNQPSASAINIVVAVLGGQGHCGSLSHEELKASTAGASAIRARARVMWVVRKIEPAHVGIVTIVHFDEEYKLSITEFQLELHVTLR